MSKSTSSTRFVQILRASLAFSVIKKSRKHADPNSVSCAISRSGQYYIGGKIESDTNLLDISSEQAALLKAVQQNDFDIWKVITLVDDERLPVSPIALKIIVDFGNRVGRIPSYQVIANSGKMIFEASDVSRTLPFYRPVRKRLKLLKRYRARNWAEVTAGGKQEVVLKKYALKGLSHAFPTYEGASSYGASVLTSNKRIYFSGQYSAPDKRLNVHAEMAAITGALMESERSITHLGLVSDKFEREPCAVCGCCRQFILELSRKFGWNMIIYCFAKNTPTHKIYTIDKLLPYSWSSKKWK